MDTKTLSIPVARTDNAPAAPATLTVSEAIDRARSLRERLIAEQAQTEERTRFSPEMQNEFISNGFYHLLRPKRFGGYEFSVSEFVAVMKEVARGCMSSGWGLTLASGHNIQAAAWFEESAQKRIFAGPYFAAASRSAPGGTLTKVEGGWLLDSTEHYASGSPYSTHFIGRGKVVDPEGSAVRLAAYIAPMTDAVILDDWGGSLGLRGSGSNTIRFEKIFLPDDFVAPPRILNGLDQTQDNPGADLHDNGMYAGTAGGFFCIELATVTIGGILGAFDEYEQLLLKRSTLWPPSVPRVADPDYQRWYASAVVRLEASQAVLDRAAELYTVCTERDQAGLGEFTASEDLLVGQLAREAQKMAWDVLGDTILRTAGSSALARGSRFERAWRDATTSWGHVNIIMTEMMGRELTMSRFPTK